MDMKRSNGTYFLKTYPLIVLTAAVLVGCGTATPQPIGGMPPPEVDVVVVQTRDLPVSFKYMGQVAGVREVDIRPRVSGILESRNYKEGATVRAGESLFTIDPAPYRAVLARAEAGLARAEATYAQAARDRARLEPLWETRDVSQKGYDDALSAKEVADANLKAAEAAVTEALLNLSYTRVEAPISGVTGRALISEGSLLEAQRTVLTTISQLDPIHVIFSFSEAEHLKFSRAVREGSLKLPKDGRFEVTLELADGSEYSRPGKVDFTDVRVNPSTGTIEARAVVPNPHHFLRPGQFARVRLSGGFRPNAVAIPQRAILEGPMGKMVMTVNAEGLVEPRPVELGDWSGEDWVILAGLHPGDTVIVEGLMKARPGSPVTVAKPTPVPAAER